MKPDLQDQAAARSMERRVFRVELPSECAGVAAALRRAFAGAAQRPTDGDFDALLRRLN